MAKELDIEKIIKKVQSEADKKSSNRFDGMIEMLEDKFEIIRDEFKGVFEKLDNISMDITEMKRDLSETKFHIISLRDTKLDKKYFVDLDQRVRRLEKK